MTQRFEALVGSRTNLPDLGVDLALQDASGVRQEIQFAGEVVPILIAALARHLAELQAATPPGREMTLQEIHLLGISPAMNQTGDLQVLLELEGGGRIALSPRRLDLPKLAEMFQELANMSRKLN